MFLDVSKLKSLGFKQAYLYTWARQNNRNTMNNNYTTFSGDNPFATQAKNAVAFR